MNLYLAGMDNTCENVSTYEGIHKILEHIAEFVAHNGLSNPEIVGQLYGECIKLTDHAIGTETDPFYMHSLQQVQGILAWHLRVINERNGIAEDCNVVTTDEDQYTLYTCAVDGESISAESAKMDIEATVTVCADAIEPKDSDIEGHNDILKSLLKQPCLNGLDDVAGLFEAKRLLNQAIVFPLKYPQLFQGARRPWKRILLYGPPGTGKTRLAHAVAGQAGIPFYCISSADLLSSWVGESEKMKTELLRQIEENSNDDYPNNAILLGATNCPWDLDTAFLRRFQRRIHIPLPDRDARRMIIKMHSMDGQEVNHASFSEAEWNELLDATDGYSGSDLANLTMSALLEPIKDLQEANFWKETSNGKLVPCPENYPGAIICRLQDIDVEKVTSREVTISDFMKGLATTRCTTSLEDISRHNEFTRKMGSTG